MKNVEIFNILFTKNRALPLHDFFGGADDQTNQGLVPNHDRFGLAVRRSTPPKKAKRGGLNDMYNKLNYLQN